MSESDYEEDLKRAVALSLEHHLPKSNAHHAPVIDLTNEEDEDDEEDDLDAPVTTKHITSTSQILQEGPEGRCSIQVENPGGDRRNAVNMTVVSDTSYHAPARIQEAPTRITTKLSSLQPPHTLGLLGLNRKQMEEQRLARANSGKVDEDVVRGGGETRKRKLSIQTASSGLPDARQAKLKLSDPATSAQMPFTSTHRHSTDPNMIHGRNPNFDADSNMMPALGRYESQGEGNITGLQSEHVPLRKNKDPEASFYNEQRSRQATAIQYPDGIVKRTWAFGYPRQLDDIKIEEVLQKSDLELAVLSGFQVDPEWITSKLLCQTKVIWVLQAKTEAEKQNYRSGAPSNFRFCFPSMEGQINCMHSKLQLLSHPKYLRVVVPSANLVPYDWGENGIMENVCFLIDLPRLPNDQKLELSKLTAFAKDLLYFITAMGLDQGTIDSIRKFDFSRTAHLAFVHSIGGSHTGADWKRTGYCGLGAAINRLGLSTTGPLSIDVVSASVGNLSESFLKSLYLASQGDNGQTEYAWRINKLARSMAVTESERKLSNELRDRLRIYFPTRETVAESKGGIGAGATICFQSKWYHAESFPRELMRDCRSTRKGLLMHSKIIFVRQDREELRGDVAWAYVGSANLSESAWGRLVKDKVTKEPKLNCRNWECGVIITVDHAARSDALSEGSTDRRAGIRGPPGMEAFEGQVPVPMLIPGEEYGGREPWFYTDR